MEAVSIIVLLENIFMFCDKPATNYCTHCSCRLQASYVPFR